MRAIRFVLRCILWTLFGLVALAGSVVYHLQQPLARNIARDFTNRFVTHEIRGELAIGRLDELTLDHVVARHVSLFDGEGRRIVSADRVELVPDFAMLRRGVLHFRVGRILGGTVRLVDNDDNQPSLFTTFNARYPSKAGDGEPLHALVDRVELRDLVLYGQIINLRGVRAEHVDADGRLEIGHTVEISIARAQGEQVLPFDFVGQIEQISGTISTDTMRGVKLNARARRDDEEISAHIEFRSDTPLLPEELDLNIVTSNITPDTLRRVGFGFAAPLTPRLRGRIHLAGPPEQLSIEGQVESEAGNAEISGVVTSARGLNVHLWTQRLELDKMIERAPSATVRGSLNISIPEAEEQPHVHAEIAATRYRGVIVPAFELDGILEDDGVRIDRARATQGGQIALRGHVGFDGRTDLQVDARFAAVQRDPNLSRYIENLQGTMTAAVRVRTPPSNQRAKLDITGRIELRDAHYGSLQAARIELTGSVVGDPALPNVDLQVHGEDFSVLSYNLGNARFELRGGPHDYVAQGEFESKGLKTLAFNAAIAADLKGFVVQADPIEFTVGTESWRGLIRDLSVVNERYVELGLLRLASRAQRLEASGILRVKGEHSLNAQLQNFDLQAVRALLGSDRFPLTHGYADASLEIRGDVDRPVLTVQGAVREARLAGFEQFDALYAVDYEKGRLQIDSELDLRDEGTLHLSGQGEINAEISDPREALSHGLYNLALSGTHVDLTLVPSLKALLDAGTLDGTVELQGGLDAVAMSGNLAAKGVQPHGWRPIELSTSIQYDHNELTFSIGAKDALGAFAKADVNWHVDWPALRSAPLDYLRRVTANDFQIRGQTLDRPFGDLPFNVPWSSAWPVRFQSDFEFQRSDGQLGGSLHGLARPTAALVDDTCRLSMSSELRSTWQLTSDHVGLSFEGRLDGHPVAAGEGDVVWPFDRFLRGEPTPETPLADLTGHADIDAIEQVPGLCRHGRGQLHGRWNLRSLFSDTPSAEVSLQASVIPEVRVAAGDTEQLVKACEKQPLQVELELQGDAKQFHFDANSKGCSAGPISLTGQVPVHWDAAHRLPQSDQDRALSATLDLQNAELKPVLDYFPGVRGFSARASGRMSVHAQHGKVNYQGQLTMSDGKLYAVSMGQTMTDIGIALKANGNWLKVENLQARVGSGTVAATGGIGFERWWPRRVQIGLIVTKFPVEREGIDLAWLTGSAAVIGEVTRDRSQLAVKLHTLSVRLPDASSRSPISLDPHPDVALITDQPRLATDKPYQFEFALDGQQISAHRNDFDANLAAEIAVKYNDPELRIGGYLEFRRGTFDVFGKRFELNRGSMRFDGSPQINPDLNLVATHQPDVQGASPVYVNIGGTLAKPVIAFYSDQCPGEGAVVLLVSGRCPTETDASSDDARGTQNAFAAGIIGGILTLGAKRELGGLIPRLAVESAAQGTRTRVKAGFETVPSFMRPLVQRVYLQGALSTGDNTGTVTAATSATTPDFLIELYFPNNIVGAGKVAPVTRSWGLDVTWEP